MIQIDNHIVTTIAWKLLLSMHELSIRNSNWMQIAIAYTIHDTDGRINTIFVLWNESENSSYSLYIVVHTVRYTHIVLIHKPQHTSIYCTVSDVGTRTLYFRPEMKFLTIATGPTMSSPFLFGNNLICRIRREYLFISDKSLCRIVQSIEFVLHFALTTLLM